MLSEPRVNSPVSVLIGVRQRRAAHRVAKTHVIKLRRLRIETDFDVAKAFAIGQLRERHCAILLRTRKHAHAIVATMTLDNAMKRLPRQKIHELSEKSLARVHRRLQHIRSWKPLLCAKLD